MTRVTVPLGEDIGFPAGPTKRKDDALDGCSDGQPRSADADQQRVPTGTRRHTIC